MFDKIQEMPQHLRTQFLEDNADKVEETSYYRPLTEDDLHDRREVLADNSIKISELTDEKKAMTDEFKGKMNPLINANKKLLKDIKSRQEEVDGILYHVRNYDSGFMETYDDSGAIVATRKLRPNEKQNTIFNIAAKAN